ncbi:long-chain-acyl-CoA synthetase [Hansschlegelia plantiphila]|uniref:Long-chain-acyl-CoA synthetase n=1 Tax=Hansschlegelia plantiphila TaxID=374655 RepID=A0A9W6J4U1_9HYPH|nr:long-chain-acyl-CoA synthetase [Hansschlegelia plantiphila]GLK69816.1 long-chain-acyl-CoA synthetase [Hansschlegelia plantiphila]
MTEGSRLTREFAFLRGALRALRATTHIGRNRTRVFPQVIAELALRHKGRVALISERETFTYSQLDARANAYARWARRNGVGKGDVVALMMLNRPDYLAFWVGVTRIGGVVALLNTNLAGSALAHCVSIVRPKHVVVAAELEGAYLSADGLVASSPPPAVWLHGPGSGRWPRIDLEVDATSGAALAGLPELTIEDRALFIYTSGTTGMPKAANINHYRLMSISHGFYGAMGIRASDRMFDCLPMYHTAGGVIAAGSPLIAGASVVIREKFQARRFWDDVVSSDCTLAQYIGELCRYLVHTPECEAEKRHRLRLVCGNGLRPDVWPEFVKRFRIPTILEWYAATEGNVAVFNFDGTPGSVGRVPGYMRSRFPVKIVQFDVEAGEAVRGPDGLCVECAPGEVGEPVGLILNDPAKPSARFEGYADPEATRCKILADAFKPGDRWFRTGDLMRQDERGYFYFVDRIGDTFRWRGENVATSEVAEAVSTFAGVRDISVYGVTVPGYEGRAGMAVVVPEVEGLDLEGLYAHVERHLPPYARPIFLRIAAEIDVTGTLKQRKVELGQEGFDPARTGDALYFADPRSRGYAPLDAALFEDIKSRRVRL